VQVFNSEYANSHPVSSSTLRVVSSSPNNQKPRLRIHASNMLGFTCMDIHITLSFAVSYFSSIFKQTTSYPHWPSFNPLQYSSLSNLCSNPSPALLLLPSRASNSKKLSEVVSPLSTKGFKTVAIKFMKQMPSSLFLKCSPARTN
jgi:hypothetical protein